MPTTRRQTNTTRTSTTPNPTIPCPIPDCPFLLPHNKPQVIQSHLVDAHSTDQICCIPSSFYSRASVFKCPLCPPPKLKLYKSNRTLTNHMSSMHATFSRTLSNTDLITDKFPVDPSHALKVSSNWSNTLRYMHRTELIPFSFRRSLYYKIPVKTRHQLQNMFHKLVQTLIESSSPHIHHNSPHTEQCLTTSVPFWKMLFVYEGTMMAPASPTEPKKHAILIQYRMDKFIEGRFDLLYKSATQKLSPPNTESPSLEQRKEQIVQAANNDDWRKASNLLQAPLPPVPYNDEFLPKIESLHPPPTSYRPATPMARPNPTLHQHSFYSSSDKIRARLKDETLLLSTLRRLKRDKSSGPFADSTDLLKNTFLVRSKSPSQDDERYPNIAILSDLLHLLYEGKAPKEIKQYVSANESVSFHKDLTNRNNIRPIGIGTAIRRVAATHAMSASKDIACEFLSPNQYAIGM